jgi:hypothetical protein
MTEKERTLLLTVARWALRLEGGVAADMGRADDPNLKKFRELIEAVEKGEDE